MKKKQIQKKANKGLKPAKRPAAKSAKSRPGSDVSQAIGRLAGVGIVVALIAVIVMMIASAFFGDIAFLAAPRAWISRLITPVQSTFSKATDGVVGYLRTLKLRANIELELDKARERIEELENQAMLAQYYKDQAEAFADLHDELLRNPQLDGTPANIIARQEDNYSYVFSIDVGKNQRIGENMAVVYSGALVGFTFDVKDNTSSVRGIVDSKARISTLIESNRDQGYVTGTLAVDGTYACRMYYYDYTSLPRPGDRVVTSGVGLEFPKGIPVGYVRESTRRLEDSKQYIVVEPIVDFDHLEHVVVFRYRPAYAEDAPDSRTQAQSTFKPMPSILPVPTLIGQPAPEITPGPDGLIPNPSSSQSPTPEPTPTAAPTRDPNATVPPPNFEYNQKVIAVETLPPLVPTTPPTPSPEPTATFSVDQLTIEADE